MVALSERARTLLNGRYFCVLGTLNPDRSIQQTGMWYMLEVHNSTDMIVMNTERGRLKEMNLRRNAHASLCVVNEYQQVTIRGPVEFVDDPEIAQYDIYRLALRHEGKESAMRQMAETFSKEQRVTLHLKCLKIYERFSQ